MDFSGRMAFEYRETKKLSQSREDAEEGSGAFAYKTI
jgi:hypothetical protein